MERTELALWWTRKAEKIKSKRNCNTSRTGSCFERVGGCLTIPFKRVLENLRVFRPQSVNSRIQKSESGVTTLNHGRI
jgi:hypothetical protein